MSIRKANLSNLDALLAIESSSFCGDRISRRQFRYLLQRKTALCLIAEDDGKVVGYALMLTRSSTALARLYSIAVAESARGKGWSRQLLEEAEELALEQSCFYMRLEVRPDNAAAIALYKKQGYRELYQVPDYYDDHAPALRMEKRLGRRPSSEKRRVPYYSQTTEFTCGPASLMMAMAALNPDIAPSPRLELQLWREATTVYMTSGHGGCGPHGLALAAFERGFDVVLMINQSGPLFLEGVRSEHKKDMLQLVHEDFIARIAESDIDYRTEGLDWTVIAESIQQGAMALVLISSYRLTRSKAPHWVLVTAIENDHAYVHDPELPDSEYLTDLDQMYLPIPLKDFMNIARYGSKGLSAAVILSNPVQKQTG